MKAKTFEEYVDRLACLHDRDKIRNILVEFEHDVQLEVDE
jgi:hypothetical protein